MKKRIAFSLTPTENLLLSIDTNILLAGLVASNAAYDRAFTFLEGIKARVDVVISELALAELYIAVRNPAVVSRPLSARDAVDVCGGFRSHPNWQVVALPGNDREMHDELWKRVAQPNFARTRIYDLRLGLSLRYFGVDEFATANLSDFQDVGFARVWNPLAEN